MKLGRDIKLFFYIPICIISLLLGCKQKGLDENRTKDSWNLGFRPNILWITCEDINPALGCYGDTNAITPNLDRLASQGIRFTNAFSTAGVCAPSRHAIITGMYQTSTGGLHMRTTSNLAPGLPDYGVVLDPGVKVFSEYLRAEGYYCTNNLKTDYQFEPPITAWDESSAAAHWRNRKAGQNFFAVFNIETTHESRIWGQAREPLLVYEEEIKVPPYYPEHPDVRRDVARKYSNIREMDSQVKILLDQLDEDRLLDSTIVFFFADHGGMLPREKRELYDTGIRVPFLVRFPNGRFAGTVTDELLSFVDLAPTVLSLAGVQIPQYMQGRAIYGNQRGEEPRKYVYAARDRMDSEYDMVRAVRDKRYKYLRNYHPELPYVQDIQYRRNMKIMNRLYIYDSLDGFAGVQKLWWRKAKPDEELYDLEKDPYEFNNLADNPKYKNKIDKFRKALFQWQQEYGDKGFVPEEELIRDMWGGSTQPTTRPVVFEKKGDSLYMYSPTPGASIAWQLENQDCDPNWNLYTGPIKAVKGGIVRAQAVRIGYGHSTITTIKM